MTSVTCWPAVVFVCLAAAVGVSTGSGRASTTAPHMIPQPDEGREKAYKVGEEVRMTCLADEQSNPTYEWYKDGEPFDLSAPDLQRLPHEGGSFVIKTPDEQHEGVYQCRASNDYGTAVTGKMTLRRAVLDPFPTVTDPTVHRPTVGAHLVLQCRPPPNSYPAGIIYWGVTRPGSNQLEAIDNNDRVVLSYEGHLYFANVENADARTGYRYVCIAHSPILGVHVQGHDQTVEPVQSSGSTPPQVAPFLLWSSPSRDVAIRGETKRLKCIFGGLPTPRVTWTRTDGSPDSRFQVTAAGFGTEIEISSVDYEDAGTYRCTAENEADSGRQATAFRDLTLNVESRPYWRQNKPPSDAQVDVEDDAELECQADGRPKPNITWSLNGHNIEELAFDPRRQVSGNRLRIENVNESDAAVVQCTAVNKHGSILANAILSVSASPPVFTSTPTNTKIVEGDSSVLTCGAFGAPKPVVTWFRGTPYTLVFGSQYSQRAGGDLEINGAALEDADTYHCQAVNKFGIETVSCSVVVRHPTTIRSPPALQIIANETDDVRIACDVSTDPAEVANLKVDWLRDGVELELERFPYLSVDESDFSLHIKDAKVHDTAGYSCRAGNGLDEVVSDTTRLIVQGRPNPPRDVVIVACETAYAELTWSPPVENNSPVLEYIVYVADSTSGSGSEVVRTRLRTAVVETHPWATYEFAVVARNAIGDSDSTARAADGERLVCATPQAAPRKNPRGVCSRLEKPRQLKIVWEPLPRHEHNGAGFYYRVGYRLLAGGGSLQLANVVAQNSLIVYNQELFDKYEIFVQSVNDVGEAPVLPGERKIGYSGEGKPLDSPRNLRLLPDTVNSTYAQFSWDPVDEHPDRIQGFFRGYQIQYWRADNPDDIRRSDVITGQPPNLCEPMNSDNVPTDLRKRRRRRHHHQHLRSPRHRRDQLQPPPVVVGSAADLWPYSTIVAGVLVLNQGSGGPLSDTVEFTTPEGVPGSVGFLEITERGSNHLTARWETPVHPNGVLKSFIIEYQVVPPNVGDLVRIVVGDPLQRSKRLLDLEPETGYRVSVAASTVIGVGESMFVDGTTLKASDPDVPFIGRIDVGDDSANVTWKPSKDKPSNPAGKFYVEYINAKDADTGGAWNRSEPTPEAADAGDNWVKVANLTPGEHYLFRVVAVNGIEPDTRESRSNPPWKERIGPPLGTSNPIYAGHEERMSTGHASASWFIILMCIIVVLLLLLLIACLIQRSRGQMYPVFEKERAWGHDPNAPDDVPFNEYTRNNEPSDPGQGSLDSDDKPDASDTDSLGEYDDQDPSKFNEDGSFIGQYNRHRSPQQPTSPGGYNTFV